MAAISSTLHYWLVNHPKVANFTWIEGQTPFSTPHFLIAAVALYLAATIILRSSISRIPSLGPGVIKPITAVHSFILFLLSLIMAIGCTISVLSGTSDPFRRSICFPLETPPSGPLFFWAYVFYLSKILEFGDTLLIILNKSIQRLTFLHVYHHATVLIMCYLWLYTRQSMFPVALVTNATVHVTMYGYYWLCALGVRPRWKRLVTDFQILQFVFSFVLSGRMLQIHFAGPGCSGFAGWCFNAVFNASLLALFLNFHTKNYSEKTAVQKRKRM